jgi:hypothetical protein
MTKAKSIFWIFPVLLLLLLSIYAFVPVQSESSPCLTCPSQNTCAQAQYLGWTGCLPDAGEWCELYGVLHECEDGDSEIGEEG